MAGVGTSGPGGAPARRQERRLLTSYQEIFLEVVGGAPDDALTHVSAGTGRSLGREVLGVAFHDCYHAGQIRQIVRMWEQEASRRR